MSGLISVAGYVLTPQPELGVAGLWTVRVRLKSVVSAGEIEFRSRVLTFALPLRDSLDQIDLADYDMSVDWWTPLWEATS